MLLSLLFGVWVVVARLCWPLRGFAALLLLLCCWAGTWIVFFSLAQTKLPSYVLPAYPAVALILGAFAETYITESRLLDRTWYRIAMGCLALVGVALRAYAAALADYHRS